MNAAISLPEVNDLGYYEMRLESIGGLGANLAGKLLGELGAVYLGLNASSFSSYGSEKRGSPVKAFIRWAPGEKEIQINSPVEEPAILGIFHENLAGKMDVMAGVSEKTKVVVNTALTPDQARDKLKMYAGELYCIDALKIAMECKTRINMVMIGAMAKASGFLPLEKVEALIRDTLGKKYPAATEKNIEGIRRGYEQCQTKLFQADKKYEYLEYKQIYYQWGYKNGPLGGVNPIFGSTVSNDVSASREGYIPVFIEDKCINCGLCDTTCPDMVFQFVPGEYKGKPAMVNKGPDYKHCKGCLRCVEICPTHALIEGEERNYDLSSMHVRNKDLIVNSMEFEHTGANSYVTSESYLDEKRVDEKNTKE